VGLLNNNSRCSSSFWFTGFLLFFLSHFLKISARIFVPKDFPICKFIISTVFKNPFSKMNVFMVQGKSLHSHCLSCSILSLVHQFRETSLFYFVYQLVILVYFFRFSSNLISFLETERISLKEVFSDHIKFQGRK
jgi:hypothetical protein